MLMAGEADTDRVGCMYCPCACTKGMLGKKECVGGFKSEMSLCGDGGLG